MKPRLLIAAALTALALSANAEVRIGVINMERVMRELEPAKKASSKLEKEFKKRSVDLEKAHQQLHSVDFSQSHQYSECNKQPQWQLLES